MSELIKRKTNLHLPQFSKVSGSKYALNLGCAIILGLLTASGSAQALTLKSGEVIGADGQIYQGASPQVKQNLLRKSVESGDKSGVFGNSLFVVAGESITFVPISAVVGKDDDTITQVVGDAVVQQLTGIAGLTIKTVTAAQEIAAAKSIPVGAAIIEQAFNEAVEALQAEDEDPVTAADTQALLSALIGPGLVNADQTPVSQDQILGLLETGDFDALETLAGLAVVDEEAASLANVDAALGELSDLHSAVAALDDLTADAWADISAEDLAEAVEYATDFAAQEAANVAEMLANDPVFAASPEGQALAEEYGL